MWQREKEKKHRFWTSEFYILKTPFSDCVIGFSFSVLCSPFYVDLLKNINVIRFCFAFLIPLNGPQIGILIMADGIVDVLFAFSLVLKSDYCLIGSVVVVVFVVVADVVLKMRTKLTISLPLWSLFKTFEPICIFEFQKIACFGKTFAKSFQPTTINTRLRRNLFITFSTLSHTHTHTHTKPNYASKDKSLCWYMSIFHLLLLHLLARHMWYFFF